MAALRSNKANKPTRSTMKWDPGPCQTSYHCRVGRSASYRISLRRCIYSSGALCLCRTAVKTDTLHTILKIISSDKCKSWLKSKKLNKTKTSLFSFFFFIFILFFILFYFFIALCIFKLNLDETVRDGRQSMHRN